MYPKNCLPLLSTFCKFQRLKVKGSQVIFVCLHQHSRSGGIDDDRMSMCWLSTDSQERFCGSRTYLCESVLNFTHGDFGMVSTYHLVNPLTLAAVQRLDVPSTQPLDATPPSPSTGTPLSLPLFSELDRGPPTRLVTLSI